MINLKSIEKNESGWPAKFAMLVSPWQNGQAVIKEFDPKAYAQLKKEYITLTPEEFAKKWKGD